MAATSRVEILRTRVTKIALALPEAEATSRTGQHTAYRVRGKAFAYYVVNEHNDGRIALHCKAAPGVQGALVSGGPDRFFVPKYIGPKGWVALDLEAGEVDWGEVAGLLAESYRLLAPKRLAAMVG
jgi:phosphoribosylglycinamide formyltransferase-1